MLQIGEQQADGSVPMVFQPGKGKGKGKGNVDIDVEIGKGNGKGETREQVVERLRGAKHGRPIAEFGENIMYKPSGDAPAFPEAKFHYGTWLGIDLRTGEILVGTSSGIVRARTVKRPPSRRGGAPSKLLQFEKFRGSRHQGLIRTKWPQQCGVRRQLRILMRPYLLAPSLGKWRAGRS